MRDKTTGGFLSGITFTYGLYAHTLCLRDFENQINLCQGYPTGVSGSGPLMALVRTIKVSMEVSSEKETEVESKYLYLQSFLPPLPLSSP